MIPLAFRERRMELGLTQAEVSRISGVSLPLIQKLEAGDGNPSWNTLTKLGEALGFAVEIKPAPPQWGLLVKAGLPLQGYPDFPGPVSAVTIALEVHKAWGQTLDERHREALAAFLFAIQRHFPTVWRRYFSRYDNIVPQQFDAGRMIKLSRIALSELCHYL